MSRSPYNPAISGPQIHDRRARDISRGTAGYIVETEVEDPYEPGAKIGVIRSTRDDPLADHLARRHIDRAQYEAGREFQRHFGLRERGPRAAQLTEAVDGSPRWENLTDSQILAGNWLARCYEKLGEDGTTLVHEMLISNRTTRQIAAARGLLGADWERYFGKRLWECLNTLAIVYGYSNGVRSDG